jgi:hypothetical protein
MVSASEFNRLNMAGNLRKRGKREFALGRLPKGEMNKTEARYQREVIDPGLANGEILWAKFEGIKLKLAPNTFLTIDFAIQRANRELELIDVKGAAIMFAEDAKAKMKIAANQYPFRFFVTWPIRGIGWHREEIGA